MVSSVAFGVLAAGALAATVIDLRTRRIPNALTAGMAAIGLALAASGASGLTVGAALMGGALGLLLMLPGYALGATGAGDVKLMGSIGILVGPGLAIKAFLFTAIAGGVLAVMVAMKRRRLAATLAGTGRMIGADARREIQKKGASSRFAYGPAIAAGSILAVLIA